MSGGAPTIDVVKIGGRAIDDTAAHGALFASLARWHEALSDAGGGLVIVHGGGAAVDRRLASLSMTTRRIDGVRVTPPDQMEIIADVLAGSVNTTLVARLNAAGARSVGLTLADGHLTSADLLDASLGRVGRITSGDRALVDTLLSAGFLPVVCSIGADHDAELLNVNADAAAADLAAILDAQRLVLLTDVPGVQDADGAVIPAMDTDDIESRIASGVIRGGMAAKVRAAAEAAAASQAPVTIAPWADLLDTTFDHTNPIGTTVRAAALSKETP